MDKWNALISTLARRKAASTGAHAGHEVVRGPSPRSTWCGARPELDMMWWEA